MMTMDMNAVLQKAVLQRKIKEVRQSEIVDLLISVVGEEAVNEEMLGEWEKVLTDCTAIRIISLKEEEAGAQLSEPTYMMIRQAASYPLLTLEDERAYGRMVMDNKDSDDPERIALCKKGEEALVHHNLRLVISIAKKHTGRGLDLTDLIQAGNEGLILAVKKYDPYKPTKLSTMATWWIRQSIIRTVAKTSRTIKVPDYMHHAVNKLNRKESDYVKLHGRKPTDMELADFTEMSEVQVQVARKINGQVPSSLDAPLGEEGESTLGDFISNSGAISVEEEVAGNIINSDLHEIMKLTLADRELGVIYLRYGIGYAQPKTLEEVGVVFGITRERARQIEAKAMAKLRNPHITERLSGYMNQ